ncbi:hypothetical protein D3C75_1243590 [compost metagenome]
MTEPITPRSAPSIKKGQRMKPLVAPTSFIILISRSRAIMVSLMVFEMRNMAVKARQATRTSPMLRTIRVMLNRVSTVDLP